MKLRKETLFVKKVLSEPDKKKVNNLIESINFTEREFLILKKNIFEKKSLKELSIEFNLSISQIAKIKKNIYLKIYKYKKSAKSE